MIANLTCFFFNKLVDQYNNTYHHSVNKKPINADYSALTEKIEKAPKLKVNDRVRLLSTRVFLVKVTLKVGQEKYLLLILFWKLILALIKLKLKTEVEKLDINNKLVTVPTNLNNLKTKLEDLDIGKLKTVLVDFKKLNDVVNNEVVKNSKFNTQNKKGNNLEKKIPDTTTLIHINQYKTDKQNLEKNVKMLIKKIPDASGLVTTTVSNTKIREVENKILDTSRLVTTIVLYVNIGEVENKIPDHVKYIIT